MDEMSPKRPQRRDQEESDRLSPSRPNTGQLGERTAQGPSGTADRLLEASKSILRRDGYKALTLRAINREAGVQNRGVTSYYFGSKAQLVEALVRDVISSFGQASFPDLPADSSVEQRVDALIDGLRKYREEYLVFFEVFPHALRDNVLRQALEKEYEEFYAMFIAYFLPDGIPDEGVRRSLEAIAHAASALEDGIAMQILVHQDNYDLDSAYEALRFYLLGALGASLPVTTR